MGDVANLVEQLVLAPNFFLQIGYLAKNVNQEVLWLGITNSSVPQAVGRSQPLLWERLYLSDQVSLGGLMSSFPPLSQALMKMR